jgi:hypothetical protein
MSADYHALLTAVLDAEKEDSLEGMRSAYTALHAAYPLCFGFVKRHAEQEVRHGSIERANAVYEDAVVLGSHCVELWSFYVAHSATHWQQPEQIRELFGACPVPLT